MHRQTAAGLLISLAVLSASSAAVGAASVQTRLRPKTWMFPILRWGPNNQKRDLRHIIALAKEMGAGIILPGMYKHYRDAPPPAAMPSRQPPELSSLPDPPSKQPTVKKTQPALGRRLTSATSRKLGACFSEPVPRFMPFDEVLDRVPIDDFVPTATVEELQAEGWDARFDALLHPDNSQMMSWDNSYYVQRAFEAQGVNAAPNAVRYAVPSPLQCDSDAIEALKLAVSRFRFVAVQVVLLGYSDMYNLQLEAQGPNRTDSAKLACHETLHQANVVVRLAPWIRDLGTRYMQEVAGIGKAPYMAVHVRPYPDSCLDRWRWGIYQPQGMREKCVPQHVNLHMRVGPCVAKARNIANLSQVFIMTHPSLRHVTNTMLTLAGLPDAMYLDASRLLALARCVDTTATFLAMVEEEIAVQATHFVGTSISTATHTVAYARIGMGAVDDEYLETMKC